jgi:hypothetical protein
MLACLRSCVLLLTIGLIMGGAMSVTRADPTPSRPKWVVAWKGVEKGRYPEYGAAYGAQVLADHLAKVLGQPVPVAPLEHADAQVILLVTDAQHVPAELAAPLEGKRRDAFVIRYPAEVDGKRVCALVAHDAFAYDFAPYYFLTRFAGMNWVGPGELGLVYDVKPDWSLPESIDVLQDPSFEHRFWNIRSFGGRPWLGRSLRMSWHHALGAIFDPGKFAQSHPEVYPLINGKRMIPDVSGKGGATHSGGWQPCVSSPASIEIATQYVLDYLEKNPYSSCASLAVNDGAGNHCMCEGCRALDQPDAFVLGRSDDLSDRYFSFYNAVIENVLKTRPDAYVGVLQYGAVSRPPRRVKVHPRVQVFMVSPSPELIVEWARAGAAANLHLWLWDGGFLVIRPDMRQVAGILRMARASGGIGVYSEVVPYWPASGPKFYVFSRLLWDIASDVDDLYDEFFRLSYGPDAGPHVRRYYQRWDEIYNRLPLMSQYRSGNTWRNTTQLDPIRRDDLEAMNQALAQAQAANMTAAQKQRLAYLQTYHQWLAANLEQFFIARELADPQWLAPRQFDAVSRAILTGMDAAVRFETLWSEQFVPDKTMWLRERDPQVARDQDFDAIRIGVSSAFDTATSRALAELSRRQGGGADGAIAYWQAQQKSQPRLEPFIAAEIDRLRGKVQPNLVTNGSFEDVTLPTTADTYALPTWPGWSLYPVYGMMKGTQNQFSGESGSGRDGAGKALGMGGGVFAEARTALQLEQGRRYKLSLWYRTVDRADVPVDLDLYHYNGTIEHLEQVDYNKLTRSLSQRFENTAGQWRHFECTFTADRGGHYLLQVCGRRQKPGQWTWIDDLEIRQLW